MGIFSRLFSKTETSPSSQRNEDGALREKARVLAPALIQVSYEHAKSLKQEILTSVDEGLIFGECLIISLHLMDVAAFQTLGAEKRSWFIDPLFAAVLARLNTDQPAAEGQEAFISLYNQRVTAYASCEFFATPNEHGGYNIRQTVGWKLAECLGIEAVETQMSLVIDISSYCVNLTEKFEMHRLLSGTD
jgi:hypothetical protein